MNPTERALNEADIHLDVIIDYSRKRQRLLVAGADVNITDQIRLCDTRVEEAREAIKNLIRDQQERIIG